MLENIIHVHVHNSKKLIQCRFRCQDCTSLGMFNRLFSLLEADCQQLDLHLATKVSGIGGASYQEYVALLKAT